MIDFDRATPPPTGTLRDFTDDSRFKARRDDPESSHHAAGTDFGSEGMAEKILIALGPKGWSTCEEVAIDLSGLTPERLKDLLALNKVWSVCLKLWREGLLERRQLPGQVIEYRRM